MTKSPQAFRSIGETARLVGVATHVLRYWEAQFPALSPVKRPDGRRYYRPDDVALAAGIHAALREDGLTLRGVQLLIDRDGGAGLRARGHARVSAAAGADDGAATHAATRQGRQTRSPRRAPKAAPPQMALFDSLPDAPPAADPAPAWLSRLTRTADALRRRDTALPPQARPLADALRMAVSAP